MNLYGMVKNNPVNGSDYLGLDGPFGPVNLPFAPIPTFDPNKPVRVTNTNPVFGNLAIQYYGYWGGSGRVNGWDRKWAEIDEDWPEQGEPGWVEPYDSYDWCYYYHDRDLRQCACKCSAKERKECRNAADSQLSSCLRKAVFDSDRIVSPFVIPPFTTLGWILDSDTRADEKAIIAIGLFKLPLVPTPGNSSTDVYLPNSKRCNP